MTRTIVDYPATDQYLMLLLTADGMDRYKSGQIVVNRSQFDPDMVGCIDERLGVPDQICAEDIVFNINDDGDLNSSRRSPSFKAKKFDMIWYDHDTRRYNNTPIGMHRDDGPAFVRLIDYETFHTNGTRTRFMLRSWSFKWYLHGRLHRDGGPYQIVGDHVDVTRDPDGGAMRSRIPMWGNFSWNHPSGGRITSEVAKTVIAKNQIDVDPLRIGATVFDSEMDESYFYMMVKE